MADISKIQVESGIYNIKDEKARNDLSTLEQNVNNKLNEINEKIENNFSEFNSYNTLNMKRISRTLELISNDYYQMQGCVYCGNDIVVRALIANKQENINNVKIQKINIKSGAIITEKIINNGGHANWLAYNSSLNEIYLTPLSIVQSEVTTNTNNIIVLDFNTLNIVNYFNIPASENIMSFTYDSATRKYYAFTGNRNVYEYNREANSLTLICTLQNISIPVIERLDSYEDYEFQGANIYNNLVYLSSMNPYGLAIFDLQGTLKSFFNYENIVNDRYLIREVEEITPLEDGNVYIGTYGLETPNGEYGMSQFFKTNVITSVGTNNPTFNPPNSRTITVDFSNTNPNPVGTVANPFKTIGEALDAINTLYFKTATINVKNGTYPFVYLNNCNCKITIGGESNTNTIIRGMQIFNAKIFIARVKINNSFNNDYNIAFTRCDAKLRDIVLAENNHNTIYATNTKLDFRYLYFNEADNFAEMFTNKHVITLNYGSSILCRDDLCPLIEFNDQSNIILKPVRFANDFSYYYGNIPAPTEFLQMIGNKSIKQIIPVLSSSQSINDRKQVQFFNSGLNSSSLKCTFNRCLNNAGVVSQLDLTYTDSSLSITGNNLCIMRSSGNEISSKTDNTPDYDYLRIVNIMLA